MNHEANIFSRLRAGVKLKTLSERDCEIINELYATGNERIVITSGCLDVQQEIDAAIPFEMTVAIEDGTPVINIFPDGAPDGKIAFSSGFVVSDLAYLKWIR